MSKSKEDKGSTTSKVIIPVSAIICAILSFISLLINSSPDQVSENLFFWLIECSLLGLIFGGFVGYHYSLYLRQKVIKQTKTTFILFNIILAIAIILSCLAGIVFQGKFNIMYAFCAYIVISGIAAFITSKKNPTTRQSNDKSQRSYEKSHKKAENTKQKVVITPYENDDEYDDGL